PTARRQASTPRSGVLRSPEGRGASVDARDARLDLEAEDRFVAVELRRRLADRVGPHQRVGVKREDAQPAEVHPEELRLQVGGQEREATDLLVLRAVVAIDDEIFVPGKE